MEELAERLLGGLGILHPANDHAFFLVLDLDDHHVVFGLKLVSVLLVLLEGLLIKPRHLGNHALVLVEVALDPLGGTFGVVVKAVHNYAIGELLGRSGFLGIFGFD